jgi:hypothetical protein
MKLPGALATIPAERTSGTSVARVRTNANGAARTVRATSSEPANETSAVTAVRDPRVSRAATTICAETTPLKRKPDPRHYLGTCSGDGPESRAQTYRQGIRRGTREVADRPIGQKPSLPHPYVQGLFRWRLRSAATT